MNLRRLVLGPTAVLVTATAVATLAAAPDTKPPRIVAAVMQDADRDTRADGLRLTYSERIRHVADRDGRYPFRVAGYPIRAVGVARGKTIVLVLKEKAVSDHALRPLIQYRRTNAKPVLDPARNQAIVQVFLTTRAHGNRPVDTPTPSPTPADRDGDGVRDGEDCGPTDPAIKPGAPDLPDLAFVDSNCDGIDGAEKDAVFASPQGKDTDPGTKTLPKREIDAAVAAAAGKGKYVLAAAGTYKKVDAATNVGVYGGYDAGNWSRRASLVTSIVGYPEGVRAENTTGVVLQLLDIRGGANVLNVPEGMSFYGVRAVNSLRLGLQRVTLTARNGEPGGMGARGENGQSGAAGADGRNGQCGGATPGAGGAGGDSPAGRGGGAGGKGGRDTGGSTGTGSAGAPSQGGTPGGVGGRAGDPGRDGLAGDPGSGGANGANGTGGDKSPANVVGAWFGRDGAPGGNATAGDGGGGGGGGGGQVCTLCNNGAGNGGGGGGSGGGGGRGGKAGLAGGGSFGLYLYNTTAAVTGASSIKAGNGGQGGRGGDGGLQSNGGSGGLGSSYCKSEIGEGGNGGPGGPGGHGGGGGGGAGGPSIGILRAGTSTVTVSGDSRVARGAAGDGGGGGAGGERPAARGESGLAQPIYSE